MEQRTSNIIACCKCNWAKPLPDVDPKHRHWANAVAAYMSEECACPAEDYRGMALEQILSTALFDYMDSADKPGADLRRLFDWPGMKPEPDMSDRIASVFSLVTVRGKNGEPVNGFTNEILAKTMDAMGLGPNRKTHVETGRAPVKCHVEAALVKHSWYAVAAWPSGESNCTKCYGPCQSKAYAIVKTIRSLHEELRAKGAALRVIRLDRNGIDLETERQVLSLLEHGGPDGIELLYADIYDGGKCEPLAASAKASLSMLV